jgi:hypothetical protein
MSKNKEGFGLDIINVCFRFHWVQVTDGLVTQAISEELQNVDDQKLVAHLTVLAELAHKVPDAFESKSEEIMNFIVKQILMTPSIRDPVRVLLASFVFAMLLKLSSVNRTKWILMRNGWKNLMYPLHCARKS